MRIAYWIGRVGDKLGSLERFNIRLAEKCLERGHEVVIVHDIPNTVPEYNRRLEAVGSKQIVVGNTYTEPLRAFPRAIRFIRTWRPDIVHTHFGSPIGFLLAKACRVPLVYQTWYHVIDHPISLRTRLIRKIGYLCTRREFALSRATLRDEIRAGVPAHHIYQLYLGLPFKDFLAEADEELTEPLPLTGRAPVERTVISVARLYPVKGMDYLLEAAVQVLRQMPSVVWLHVGTGPMMSELQQRATESEVGDRFFLLGRRQNVPRLMRDSWVHVLASLEEGLGLVAVEASALGVPTVGTQIRGLDEAVIDGVTGLLVPPRSSSALAEATLRVLKDPDLRNRLGRAARDYVFAHFDADPLIDKLLDTYEQDMGEIR